MEKSVEQKHKTYKRLFSTSDGKAVLEDLSKFCHYNRPCWKRGDINETILAEGHRNVFLYVKSLIERKEQEND